MICKLSIWKRAQRVIPFLAMGLILSLSLVAQSGPTITSISPDSATVGSPVTIDGSGFGTNPGSGTVTFNGVAATPQKWTTSSITVSVPAGATTGPVVVTVTGASSNAVTFKVFQAGN